MSHTSTSDLLGSAFGSPAGKVAARRDRPHAGTAFAGIPPHDLDAEQSVLGAMLDSPSAVDVASEILRADDFYKPAHGRVFESITELTIRGERADAVTVADDLRRRGLLEHIGGKPYLLGFLGAYPTASSARHYASIVRSHSARRALISAGHDVIAIGADQAEDVAVAIDRAEATVFDVGDSRRTSNAADLSELLAAGLSRIEERADSGGGVTGLASGFVDLDELTAGFHPGTLTVVAARPSQGKTSLVADFAMNAALSDSEPVLIFSLEMTKEELTERMLSAQGKVNSQSIRKGQLTGGEWARITAAAGRLSEAQVVIDDSGINTVMQMRAACRRLKAKRGLSLVVVDYLQLLRSSARRRDSNRQEEVAEITKDLKALAKDLGVPVVCAAQLNRGLELRADKRPLLADLRESGEIEQSADLVMFIYRDEVYNEQSESRGVAEIILAKQRSGPTGTVRLAFLEQFTRFASLGRPGPLGS